MRKIFLLLASSFLIITANAQLQTLGGRLGFGAELSAQYGGNANRAEADLGIFRNHASFALAYHRVNILEEDFNWYYGFGGIGEYDKDIGVSAGVIAVLGLEYNFKIPIQVSLDYRPAFFIIRGGSVNFDSDLTAAGIGIRYRFK